jgi:hypothetical protein
MLAMSKYSIMLTIFFTKVQKKLPVVVDTNNATIAPDTSVWAATVFALPGIF